MLEIFIFEKKPLMIRLAFSFFILIFGFSSFGQCTLRAHFRLDGNAADSSSFNNHGIISGGATSTVDRFGQVNGAMHFDGINDYINTLTTYDYQERTVSFWFKAERIIGANAVLIQDANTLTYGAFSTRVFNGDMRGRAGQASGSLMFPNVNLNQWYHIALVRRTDSAIYYVNGVKTGGVLSGSGGSSTSPYNKLVIGAGRQRNVSHFEGSIDDIKVYDCAFTAVQVDSLSSDSTAKFTAPNCIVGDYRLDGNAIDSSIYVNHGSIFGGATGAVDRFNQANGALYFDGTNDYLNTFTTHDYPYRTVSIWMYPQRGTGLNQVFTHDDISLTYGTFFARISNGDLSTGSAGNSATALSNVNLNEWYHIALVSRPDSGFCYINGQQVVAAPSSSNGSISGAYNKLVLAVDRQRNQKFYEGRLDDLLILNCDLSPQQIDSLFIAQSLFPPFDTLSLDTTLCLGDSLYFDLDGGSSISYFWDNGSMDTVRKITNPGTYTLRQTRGGDTLIDTIRLSFTTPYIPTSLDTSFCTGNSLNVDFSALSADSLVWFDGDTSQQRTFNTTGTFVFTVYQEACGISSDSIRLNIDTILTAISIDASSCQDTLRIGSRTDTVLNYQWSTGQSTPNIQVNASGIYTVQVAGACNTVIDTFRVELPKILPAQLPPDTLIICANSDSAQVGFSIDPALSYIWSNGATSALQWINLAGNYTLQVFNICDTIEYVCILQYRDIFKPEAIQDTNLCETDDLEFDLNYPRIEDVTVNGRVLFGNLLTVSEAGIYVIEYEQECGITIDSFSVEIISCECDFILPDAFSPNGDGLNDRFRIENQCEDLNHTIQIFNRWGVLVFENQSNTDFWDGNHNGNAVSSGVYLYKMNFSGSINNKSYQGFKQGFITLIR
jgi:gliding motility-associated-like protein